MSCQGDRFGTRLEGNFRVESARGGLQIWVHKVQLAKESYEDRLTKAPGTDNENQSGQSVSQEENRDSRGRAPQRGNPLLRTRSSRWEPGPRGRRTLKLMAH